MLSTLRWAGSAANANSLADPNATFDPTLPCASGEEAARDTIVKADAPKRLLERLAKKPQEISPDCLFENAESIIRFYEEDIILHVIKQEVKDKRVSTRSCNVEGMTRKSKRTWRGLCVHRTWERIPSGTNQGWTTVWTQNSYRWCEASRTAVIPM